MNLKELAERNQALKRERLARLGCVKGQAIVKADAFRLALNGAKETRAAFEEMASLLHVPGFFPTPKGLVERMIQEAGSLEGLKVLEPSAGKGDIAKQARNAGALVSCVEYNFSLAGILRSQFEDVQCADFLSLPASPTFDAVLMNPPFERGADLKHVEHAFGFLKPSGSMVAIVSSTTGLKLQQWATERGGYVEPLPQGSFSCGERPTAVSTALVVAFV